MQASSIGDEEPAVAAYGLRLRLYRSLSDASNQSAGYVRTRRTTVSASKISDPRPRFTPGYVASYTRQ